jgi:hypothetical protein
MMRAILIDAVEKTVTEIDMDGKLQSLYRLLGCNLVEAVELDDRHSLWVDEEGLMVENPGPFFAFKGGERPYPFKGVILGDNHQTGSNTDAVVPLDVVQSVIEWPDVEFAGFEEINEPGILYGVRAAFRDKGADE